LRFCPPISAALLDFLNAEMNFRTVQRTYPNLVGARRMAASQLNLAVRKAMIS